MHKYYTECITLFQLASLHSDINCYKFSILKDLTEYMKFTIICHLAVSMYIGSYSMFALRMISVVYIM